MRELGGLAEFVDGDSPALDKSGDVRSWAAAPMGGYRLARESDHELRWTDLADGEEVTTINLGTVVGLDTGQYVVGMDTGQCVVGRLVESQETKLFDIVPCGVQEGLARVRWPHIRVTCSSS